jgi:hypothetical protein
MQMGAISIILAKRPRNEYGTVALTSRDGQWQLDWSFID